MGKYAPLKTFLIEQGREHVPMTFAEIERILNLRLPASKQYPAWWSNNPSNNTMTREWLDAGYETESVDTVGEKLVFRRTKSSRSGGPEVARGGSGAKVDRPSGFGFMKDHLTIEEGYDVTQPLDEVWDEGYLGLEQRR